MLIVDDDRALLETTAALLEDEFDVRTAPDARTALALLEREPSHVVCTDYDMPEVDGVALLRRIRALYPQTSGILVTGLKDQLPRGLTNDEAVFAVVYKPYTPETLFRTIRDASKLVEMTRAVTSFGRSSRKLGKK